MKWSYKFAFDNMQDMMDNRPWLILEDENEYKFIEDDHDVFLGKQKKLYMERGWDWFINVIRGRFFPNLNLTTITTWYLEENPGQGEPDFSKVQQRYPGASIVSLVGSLGPHVISGPEIESDILGEVATVADAQYWNQKINKMPSIKIADQNRLIQLLSDAWKIPAAGIAGGTLALLLSIMQPAQLEQAVVNGASMQDIMDQAPDNSYIPTSFTKPDTVNEEVFEENTEISPEVVGNPTENARIPQVNEGNLDGLDPMFAQQIRQVLLKLTEKGWQPRVAEGLRSLEQQQTKIDQGYSSLKDPRHSKHVQGKAADIIDSRYGWGGPASDLSFQFWTDLGEVARELGLTWGGDWKTFKDVAHVEIHKETTGASVVSYHYAYQEIDRVKDMHRGKQIVELWGKFLWQPDPRLPRDQDQITVTGKLMEKKIPTHLFGELFKEYQIFRSKVLVANNWSHIYAENGNIR